MEISKNLPTQNKKHAEEQLNMIIGYLEREERANNEVLINEIRHVITILQQQHWSDEDRQKVNLLIEKLDTKYTGNENHAMVERIKKALSME